MTKQQLTAIWADFASLVSGVTGDAVAICNTAENLALHSIWLQCGL